jgi:hypothetical protein
LHAARRILRHGFRSKNSDGRAFSEPSLIVFIRFFGQLGLFLPGFFRKAVAKKAVAVVAKKSRAPNPLHEKLIARMARKDGATIADF